MGNDYHIGSASQSQRLDVVGWGNDDYNSGNKGTGGCEKNNFSFLSKNVESEEE